MAATTKSIASARPWKGDFVLKRYFQDPADPRDRYNNERAFYDLADAAAVRRFLEPQSLG